MLGCYEQQVNTTFPTILQNMSETKAMFYNFISSYRLGSFVQRTRWWCRWPRTADWCSRGRGRCSGAGRGCGQPPPPRPRSSRWSRTPRTVSHPGAAFQTLTFLVANGRVGSCFFTKIYTMRSIVCEASCLIMSTCHHVIMSLCTSEGYMST